MSPDTAAIVTECSDDEGMAELSESMQIWDNAEARWALLIAPLTGRSGARLPRSAPDMLSTWVSRSIPGTAA